MLDGNLADVLHLGCHRQPGAGLQALDLSRHLGGYRCAQPAKGRWAGVSQTHEEVVHNALRALENGGGLTVPGALNKVSGFAQRLIPPRLVPRLVAKMSRPRWEIRR